MGASFHAEFLEQRGDVVFDGFFGEVEAFAYLPVGESFADQFQDFAFLTGQSLQRVAFAAGVAEPGHELAGGFGVQHGLAGGDGADRAYEVGAADLLEDVAGGAGHDGVEEGFVVAEGGQHEAGDLGELGADLAADRYPVAVG